MNNKLKITHDISDFHEGEEIILTLKDQYLLKDDDLNEDQEQLENIQLREKGQTQFNAYMRENIHKLAHVNTSHLQYKLEGNAEKAILPHYDQRKYQKEGFNIDLDQQRNQLVVTKGIIQKMKQEKEQKQQEALGLKQNVIASEYLAPQKKVIKARKITDKTKGVKQLISFLEQDAQVLDNLNMRKKQMNELKNNEQEGDGKYDKNNFNNAVKKAQEKVRAVEQYELQLALLKQRNKNKQHKFAQPKPQPPTVSTQQNPVKKMVQLQLDPIMAFHKANKDALQQISFTSSLSLKDTKSGSASVLNVPLPSQRLFNQRLKQSQQIPDSFNDIPPQQLQAMKKQLQFMQQKQNVGVGLSGTLKFLREKGMLNRQQLVGRSKDERINYNQPGDRVVLQYRDQQGRLLTQREAYRMISRRFHGQQPGKNKLQKKRKRQLLEQKIKRKQAGGTTMMNILQSQTDEAHMFIKRQ